MEILATKIEPVGEIYKTLRDGKQVFATKAKYTLADGSTIEDEIRSKKKKDVPPWVARLNEHATKGRMTLTIINEEIQSTLIKY